MTEPIKFAPHVGDHVDFLSDRQTEKGPSGGRVLIVEGTRVAIKHSDCVEWFDTRSIIAVRYTPHNPHLHQPSPDWTLV